MKSKKKKKQKQPAPKIVVNLCGNPDPKALTKFFSEQINKAYTQETSYFSLLPKVIYLGHIDWICWGEMKMLPPPRNYAREADIAIGSFLHRVADIFYQEFYSHTFVEDD